MKQLCAILRTVLRALKDNRLFCKKSKCLFGVQEVSFVGYKVTAQGVHTEDSKVEAVSLASSFFTLSLASTALLAAS